MTIGVACLTRSIITI